MRVVGLEGVRTNAGSRVLPEISARNYRNGGSAPKPDTHRKVKMSGERTRGSRARDKKQDRKASVARKQKGVRREKA